GGVSSTRASSAGPRSRVARPGTARARSPTPTATSSRSRMRTRGCRPARLAAGHGHDAPGPARLRPPVPVSRDLFRQISGSFPTGVVVVTTLDPEGAPKGLLTQTFVGLSTEPPLVLISIDTTSRTLSSIQRRREFVLNFLRQGSEDTAGRSLAAHRLCTTAACTWPGRRSVRRPRSSAERSGARVTFTRYVRPYGEVRAIMIDRAHGRVANRNPFEFTDATEVERAFAGL